MARRPSNEDELQAREAIGVIRASRFIRKYARTHKPITMESIREIHHEIFRDAWPEIAGVYRTENLKITESKHLPPHHTQVAVLMNEVEVEFRERLKTIEKADGTLQRAVGQPEITLDMIDRVVRVAVWLHHKITYIHPFREGNGRTARLAANLILERNGLVGISIKVEKENKNRYRRALAQADIRKDYEPLVEMMYEGLIDRYNGVVVKYYDAKSS